MASPELGLRERKRLATRRAIQRAALQVVRERGLEGATVDEISRVADVSPRTFFNYFPSKEDAILGDAPTLEGSSVLDDFLADRGPILPALGRAIVGSAAFLMSDVELVAERRALGKLYPELNIKRMANVHRFELELTDLAERRLAIEHPELDADARRDRAHLVALTAFAFMRHAWFSWVEHADAARGLPELLETSFEMGESLVASSHASRVG